MPAAESVAEFIASNNAVLDRLKELLMTATNQALPRAERVKALGTAGHEACEALKRLYKAEKQLWAPLRQQLPRIYEAPQAPVPQELFELFRHPWPDEAVELVNQSNRLLEEAIGGLAIRGNSPVEHAKRSVLELQALTCQLVNAKVPWQRRIQALRTAINMIAMGSLGAAAIELQQRAWQAGPELLRQAYELLRYTGHTIESLPLLGLTAVVAVEVAAVLDSAFDRGDSRMRSTSRRADRPTGIGDDLTVRLRVAMDAYVIELRRRTFSESLDAALDEPEPERDVGPVRRATEDILRTPIGEPYERDVTDATEQEGPGGRLRGDDDFSIG